jgi:hypothetical protein
MNFKGVIIEEGLADTSVLKKLEILETKVEEVTETHKTPWLKQWTLHTVEIPDDKANEIAEKISKSLDYSHNSSWYADFKNDNLHYIIFQDKVFKVNRNKPEEYKAVTKHGVSLGIPDYQLDFSPEIK